MFNNSKLFPLENGVDFPFDKLECPLPTNAQGKVWLKSA